MHTTTLALALAFSAGGFAAAAAFEAAQDPTQKAYPEASQRGNARIFYWGKSDSAGQVAIDYGQPVWQKSYDAQIDSPNLVGRRWRLGQNFWTNLDTNIDLTVGGVRVPSGYWYLTLERDGDGRFWLAVLDPVKVRAQKLDSYHAHQTSGGIMVPMEYGEAPKTAKRLTIALAVSGKNDDKATFTIDWGDHRLSVPVVMHRG